MRFILLRLWVPVVDCVDVTGEEIQQAINTTQTAMQRLKAELQFNVNQDIYNTARANASKSVYDIRRRINGEFEARTRRFEFVIFILKKLFPLAVLLLVYVSYLHVKFYLTVDSYDNNYITATFRQLDVTRAEVSGYPLLPLKRYERNALIDVTQCDLTSPEDGLYSIGLGLVFVHLLLSFACYMLDYILYWILNLIQDIGNPPVDTTGQAALEDIFDGHGAIVEIGRASCRERV